VIIRKKNELIAKEWSGGTTTELFIYPKHTSYQLQNFDIRISTATVGVEVASFTSLPGFQRTLLVIHGQLTMQHEKGGETTKIRLESLQQAGFSGDWKTTGYGKVTDFNVMCSSAYSSITAVRKLFENDELEIEHYPFRFLVYLLSGTLTVDGDQLHQGDTLIGDSSDSSLIVAIADTELVLVCIQEKTVSIGELDVKNS